MEGNAIVEARRVTAPDPAAEAKRPSGMKFGVVYDSSYNHITFLYLSQAIPQDRRLHFDLNVLKPNFDLERLLETRSQYLGLFIFRNCRAIETIPEEDTCQLPCL